MNAAVEERISAIEAEEECAVASGSTDVLRRRPITRPTKSLIY